jgi:transcription antitermination factor NusG
MIPMAEYTFKLLASRNGEKASVSGATQIRAGVMRPEIIIPGYPKNVTQVKQDQGRGWIEPGDPVRIIREPHFGVIGTVSSLPPELTKISSESKVRILEVTLPGGEKLIVPRANIEVLEK